MSAWRWIVAGAVITALTVAIGFVLLDDDAVPGPGTVAAPTTQPATTTSTVAPSTTPTTAQPSDVPSTMATRDRVGEVEQILTDLFFGWYDAIYRADGDALWGVVATTAIHDAGVAAMDFANFIAEPSVEVIDVEVLEILLDRDDCLVVHYRLDVDALLGPGPIVESVQVLWPDTNGLHRVAGNWGSPNDLWIIDCDVRERSEDS